MNQGMIKRMKTIAKKTIKQSGHKAMVFSREEYRDGNDWKEAFVLVAEVPALFYTISRTGSMLNAINIENGQEESESLLRVMFLELVGDTGDRVVPIIRGDIGGEQGVDVYEVMEKPLSPSFQGVTYEAPLKQMSIPFKIKEIDGQKLLIVEKE